MTRMAKGNPPRSRSRQPPKKKKKPKPPPKPVVSIHPSLWGMVGGATCGTLALVFYFIRQSFGVAYEPQAIVIGAALTFVIAYTAVGVFVLFLRQVGHKELDFNPEEGHVRHLGERPTEEQSPEPEAPETHPEGPVLDESLLSLDSQPIQEPMETERTDA